MRSRSRICYITLLALALVAAVFATAIAKETQQKEPVNIAVVATPSASFTSGDTTLTALNDNVAPTGRRGRGGRTYGNWGRRGTQWVQYDWAKPISTKKIDVYWWDDRGGVRVPASCKLLYWNGSDFVPVKDPNGLGVENGAFNTTTFDEVTTSKLKLEIVSGEGSTGLYEWKVYDSGKSPKFPPSVSAGIDRVVMVGGKTYLSGTTKTLGQSDSVTTKWSKASGPGDVKFADDATIETTAVVSKPGKYTLKLTATDSGMSTSATLNVEAMKPPMDTELQLIDTKQYTLDSPLWNQRAKALIVNWVPHCIDKINDPNLKEGGINNLVDAANKLAGKPHGNHRGYVFSNAWIFNTLESICIALMVDPQGDPEIIAAQKKMQATLDDWIPKILAAQEPDGYFQTAFTLSTRPREHWSPRSRGDHEGYVAGYFLEAATAHYMLTNGKDMRLYNAAKKLADCWETNVGPAPKKEWYDGHQAMEMGLVRFGRFVNKIEGREKGEKYIALSKFLLDCRKEGNEYDQSHVPVQQQYEAVGHAVRASYSYAGMSDVAMETHDTDYQSAVMSLWDNIVNKKYYITGGIGSGETSEGFGPNYSLRNNAYCESCSSCGQIFFQHKLNLAYHDAKFADLYEETLYNALLGSVDMEGKNFYYTNALDTSGPRYPWHGCPCCVGNIPRVLLALPTWMYLKSDTGIYVNLYIGSTVTIEDVAGTDVQMVQKTDYPWKGDVAITVNPKTQKKFTVNIRAPHNDVSVLYNATPNSDGISAIKVNGKEVTTKVERGYAAIERTWKKGDKIEFVVNMKVQRVKADERIEADRGKVALRYGPLVYNFEQVDQDVDKVLSPDAKLTTQWRKDLLQGIVTIDGKFKDGTPFMAIPNYARMNRGTRRENVDTSQIEGGPGTVSPNQRRRGGRLGSTIWIKDQD